MVSIYDIKPAFQRALQPVLLALVRAKITPNQVTLAALLLSALTSLLLLANARMDGAAWVLLLLPVVLLVRMALNALDGMLARTQNLSTRLGEILNELGDVLADIALYWPLSLYVWEEMSANLIVGFVLLAVLSEFSGLLAKIIGASRHYDGPMGKSDRAFVVAVYALFLYFRPLLVMDYSNAYFAILDILLVLTCWNRLRGGMKEVSA